MNGEQLALLRSKLELSQKAFAEKIGMSPSAVAMVEANHRKMSALMRGKIAANIPITDDLLIYFESLWKLDKITQNNSIT